MILGVGLKNYVLGVAHSIQCEQSSFLDENIEAVSQNRDTTTKKTQFE